MSMIKRHCKSTIDIIIKIDCLMTHTACLVCLVSTVSGCHKNTLRRANASGGHITKFEQTTFLRYIWCQLKAKIFKLHRCLIDLDIDIYGLNIDIYGLNIDIYGLNIDIWREPHFWAKMLETILAIDNNCKQATNTKAY